MTIENLVAKAGWNAIDKGLVFPQSYKNSFIDYHKHIKSELKELRKAVKPWNPVDTTTTLYDPNSFEAELADIVIRTASYCDWIGVDLQKAITDKMAYNEKRSSGKDY